MNPSIGGLTPVGSPNRIKRRQPNGQSPLGSLSFNSRQHSQPTTPTAQPRSSFVERVQQSKSLQDTSPKVDLPSQRIYLLALLGFLAAYKLYDASSLLFTSTSSPYLFVKWTLLDSLMWYGGWRLRTPQLALSRPTLYIVAAASLVLNLNMFLLSTGVFALTVKPVAVGLAGQLLKAMERIPVVGPRWVGDSDLLVDTFELDEAHILGRHTIHILPHSLAQMNPRAQGFCITRPQAKPWYSRLITGAAEDLKEIPILVNGTRPYQLSYRHLSLETGEQVVRRVKDVGRLRIETHRVYKELKDWSMATYYLPVQQTGLYEIESVRDERGLEFRTARHQSATVVVECPRARLEWHRATDDFQVSRDGIATMCQRDNHDNTGVVEVVTEGYEPVEVKVVRLVDGQKETVGVDSAKPALEGWKKYRAQKRTYPLTEAFARAGEYVYRLENIRDAANHTVVFNEEESTRYMARVQVHRRPHVSWSQHVDGPLRLSRDKRRASEHRLPLQLVGEGPWTVGYEIDGAKKSETFAESSKGAAIVAKQAGTYRLTNVKDRHCTGNASPSNVTLVDTPQPTVNISGTPILAKECGGEIGALVSMEFSGRPPFQVQYRERNLRYGQRALQRTVHTNQHHYSFRTTPELAGDYLMEFYQLMDDNYPSGVQVAETLKQSIHAQPSAKWETAGSVVCLGDRVDLVARLRGVGPWQLVYRASHGDQQKEQVVKEITDEVCHIELAMEQAGEHWVELVEVKDRNGCARDLQNTEPISIRVRAGGPRAAFQCPSEGLQVLEDERVRLPISVVGEDHEVQLEYKKRGDDRAYSARVGTGQVGVMAYGPGEYQLAGVRDQCQGTVDPAVCRVLVAPRPRAWFQVSELQSTCENSRETREIPVGASGSGPWKIQYQMEFWNPQHLSTSQRQVAMQGDGQLKTEGTRPGLYKYRLVGVSDQRYQGFQPLDQVVAHRVTAGPRAELRAYQAGEKLVKPSVRHCLAPNQQMPVVRVEFQDPADAPPFEAWVEVADNQGINEALHLEDIHGSTEVQMPEHLRDKVGKYQLRLLKTRDSRGCERTTHQTSSTVEVEAEAEVEMELIEAPSVRPADSGREACVGDVLAFELQNGAGQWTVEYTYNGASRRTHVHKKLFRRIADQPGHFNLTRVCHRKDNGCCSQFDDLNYTVHGIPRASMNGGRDVHQDMLEGDMAEIKVELEGTPPFAFTWQRRNHKKVLETHTVKDLETYQYTIRASREGTFEVTFVQDQHCKYPKK